MEIRLLCAVLTLFLLDYVCAQKEGDPNVCSRTLRVSSTVKSCDARGCQNRKKYETKLFSVCCKGYYYLKSNDTCMPHCPRCVGGICIKPDVCICSPPMILKNNKCIEPKCSTRCVNAKCIDDERCECDEGYLIYNSTHCARLCPNGFINDPHTLECQPKCENSCENGYCSGPNTCSCNKGYVRDNNTCVPYCPKPCMNGKCIAPDICECNDGYSKDSSDESICLPVCENQCINATCVEPNKCACHLGFENVNPWTCKPKCDNCDNGECIAPNQCRCLDGYLRIENICTPICSEPCSNGYCSAPNTCKCNNGYELDSQGKCQPICKDPCNNANCTAPDTCTCLSGYEPVNKFVCAPKCDDCSNGVCVSPGQCQCNPGYEKAFERNGTCSPVCSSPCVNADCLAPEQCFCKTGYIANSTDPYICYKPCTTPCNNGTCDIDGNCLCDSKYKMFNGSCIIPENCDECNGTCHDEDCKCENEIPCYYQLKDDSAEAATVTSLAGLQLTWLLGGCAGILLVTLVILVIGYIWRKRREYGVKPADENNGYGNVSVLTTMPDTLIHRRYSDNNRDVIDEEAIDEEDEENPNKKFLTNVQEADF